MTTSVIIRPAPLSTSSTTPDRAARRRATCRWWAGSPAPALKLATSPPVAINIDLPGQFLSPLLGDWIRPRFVPDCSLLVV